MKAWIAALGFGAVLLTACNRPQARKVVAVIPKGNADIFWQSAHAGAVKAGGEAGADVLWNGRAAATESTVQLQIVHAMLNRRVDPMPLARVDGPGVLSGGQA